MSKIFIVQSLWDRDHNQVLAACADWNGVKKVAEERWKQRGSPSYVSAMRMVSVSEVDVHVGEDEHAV